MNSIKIGGPDHGHRRKNQAILWLFGILLAILAALFATVVGMALSVFVYPYALIKNFKQVKGIVPFEDD